MEELQREGAFKSRVLGSGLLVPTNLATVVVEDKPVGRAQEGVSVPPPPQDFRGERLPQDHMVSHCVCILRGGRCSGDARTTQCPGQWHFTHCVPLRHTPHL